MSAPPELDEAVLRAVLERGTGRVVCRVSARRSRYTTSFPIYDVRVDFGDGARADLILKDLAWGSLDDAARTAKPWHLHDPAREVAVYRHLLPALRAGTPELLAAEVDEDAGRSWLVLEKVVGCELYQVGELRQWEAVAAWLGRFHRVTAPLVEAGGLDALPLLRHGEGWLRGWFDRARCNGLSRAASAVIGAAVDVAVDELGRWPTSVVHGEFYASNVLVGAAGGRDRVCPVDWEVSAVGVGLVDLAALSAGGWDTAQLSRIEGAYLSAWRPGAEGAHFDAALAAARLQLAVQWLGWSRSWAPPAEHRQDWTEVALGAAEELLA